MSRFAEKYRVESTRLANWDYSSPGIYFITICTYRHNNHFGKIVNRKTELNKIGLIVNEGIQKTFQIRDNLKLHDYVIMPNHIHLLLEILFSVETPRRDVSTESKNIHRPHIAITKWKKSSVGSIINQIKSISAKRINKLPALFGWQSRYYDEIITDPVRLQIVKYYIKNNPKNWNKDKLYSEK